MARTTPTTRTGRLTSAIPRKTIRRSADTTDRRPLVGVFTFWQRGCRNVVSTLGASLSPTQERLRVEAVGSRGKVLLCFGSHKSAVAASCHAVLRLAPQVFVRTVTLDA